MDWLWLIAKYWFLADLAFIAFILEAASRRHRSEAAFGQPDDAA